MYKTILNIPDQHVFVGCNLRRFEALGNFIIERRPDHIVNGGDQTEMECLYGISNKKSWSFREETAEKVEEELNTARMANQKIFGPLIKLQNRNRKSRKKQYKPDTDFCLGNHDIRAELYWKANREAFQKKHPKTNVDKWMGFSDYYHRVHPFQKPVIIQGITFSHNYVNGTATASTADTIGKLAAQSAVGFHSHKAEFKASYTSTKRPLFVLQSGWFFDPDEELPNWVGPQGGSDWWNGITMLHGCDGSGFFEPEFISTERLLREYL